MHPDRGNLSLHRDLAGGIRLNQLPGRFGWIDSTRGADTASVALVANYHIHLSITNLDIP